MVKFQDDDALILLLKSQNEADVRKAYYRYESGFIRNMMALKGCEREVARELYAQAFSIMYFNVLKNKLTVPLVSSLLTYLTAIGKNLHMRKNNIKYNRMTSVLDERVEISADEWVTSAIQKESRGNLVRELLNQIGEPCRKLLLLFYWDELSFREISDKLGEEEGRLRKRKFDCLKKLHNLMKYDKREWE
jgi:RNA polymerase sigma factor (sigma-70 family)